MQLTLPLQYGIFLIRFNIYINFSIDACLWTLVLLRKFGAGDIGRTSNVHSIARQKSPSIVNRLHMQIDVQVTSYIYVEVLKKCRHHTTTTLFVVLSAGTNTSMSN